jgi:hypothetical protein
MIWYYSINGTQAGPVAFSMLGNLAQEGSLKGDDLVWGPGLESWSPARVIEGLMPPLLPAPATAPPPLPAATPPPLPASHTAVPADDRQWAAADLFPE